MSTQFCCASVCCSDILRFLWSMWSICLYFSWPLHLQKGNVSEVILMDMGKINHYQITTRTPAFWGYPSTPYDCLYYWAILDPKSEEDKVKVTNLKNSSKFQTLHMTHLLKLLDKMCKYEMDPMSIVEDTERTRFGPQTDRWTDGQGETSIPPFQLRWSGGYNKPQQSMNFVNTLPGRAAVPVCPLVIAPCW